MKMKRIISALLAVLMLMSALVLVIGAEEAETENFPLSYWIYIVSSEAVLGL